MKRIVKKLLLSFLLLVTVGDFVAFSQNFLNRKAEKVVTQQDYTEIFRSIEKDKNAIVVFIVPLL